MLCLCTWSSCCQFFGALSLLGWSRSSLVCIFFVFLQWLFTDMFLMANNIQHYNPTHPLLYLFWHEWKSNITLSSISNLSKYLYLILFPPTGTFAYRLRRHIGCRRDATIKIFAMIFVLLQTNGSRSWRTRRIKRPLDRTSRRWRHCWSGSPTWRACWPQKSSRSMRQRSWRSSSNSSRYWSIRRFEPATSVVKAQCLKGESCGSYYVLMHQFQSWYTCSVISYICVISLQ